MTDHWFLIDRAAVNLAEIRSDCFERNAIITNNALNMIEVRSYSGEELLIGIMGGNDQAWLGSLLWVNTAAVIWHGDAADANIDALVTAWREAQRPNRDADQDGNRDTTAQRKSWWMRLLNN